MTKQIVQICRSTDTEVWMIISNMKADENFKAACIILSNSFNEYMSYINCGVEYRFIRRKDLSKYVNVK